MPHIKIAAFGTLHKTSRPVHVSPGASARLGFGATRDSFKARKATGMANPLASSPSGKPPSFTALVMALARGNVDPVSARWARKTLRDTPELRRDLEQRLTAFCKAQGLVLPTPSHKSKLTQLENQISAVLSQVASPHFKAFYEGRHQFTQGLIYQALTQGHAVAVDEFGAGLDPVVDTFAKARQKHAIFINEHDEQATQQFKQALLGKKLPKNVKLHGLNFEKSGDQRDKMQAGLGAAQDYFGKKPVQHLLFMKGLLYYLEPEAVQGLFKDILNTYPVGSKVFADCYTHQNWQNQDALTLRYRQLLSALGEHVKFTTDNLAQAVSGLRSEDGTKKLVIDLPTQARGTVASQYQEDPMAQDAIASDAFGNASLFYQLKIVPVEE